MPVANQHIPCPIAAIEQLSGNALRVYLALRYYGSVGGNLAVSPVQLSDTLGIDRIEVILNLIQLRVLGWLVIDVDNVKDFFSDETLIQKNWLITDSGNEVAQDNKYVSFIHHLTDADSDHLFAELFGKALNANLIQYVKDIKEQASYQKLVTD